MYWISLFPAVIPELQGLRDRQDPALELPGRQAQLVLLEIQGQQALSELQDQLGQTEIPDRRVPLALRVKMEQLGLPDLPDRQGLPVVQALPEQPV